MQVYIGHWASVYYVLSHTEPHHNVMCHPESANMWCSERAGGKIGWLSIHCQSAIVLSSIGHIIALLQHGQPTMLETIPTWWHLQGLSHLLLVFLIPDPLWHGIFLVVLFFCCVLPCRATIISVVFLPHGTTFYTTMATLLWCKNHSPFYWEVPSLLSSPQFCKSLFSVLSYRGTHPHCTINTQKWTMTVLPGSFGLNSSQTVLYW
jgi:hypothetical protein